LINQIAKISILFIILACYVSCTNNPNFNTTPEISFISYSKMEMEQNDLNSDSLFITLAFKDGDGDIGGSNNGVTENIIVTDNRTGLVYDFFKIPEIVTTGLQNGIEGEMRLKLFTTCCIFPDSIPPCLAPPQYPSNELSFTIVMVDDNGNRSEEIVTPSITLLCN